MPACLLTAPARGRFGCDVDGAVVYRTKLKYSYTVGRRRRHASRSSEQPRYVPANDRFVIHPPSAAEARRAFGSRGIADELGAGVFVMRVPHPTRDAKSAWRALLAQEPEIEWAVPVLLDASGEPHYPTGEVTVRFDRLLSDGELDAFARHHGLGARRRNEFVPNQVLYVPLDARSTYLPELVAALQRAPGVVAAWASTRSRYRRP